MISDDEFIKKLIVKGLSRKYKEDASKLRKKLRSILKTNDHELTEKMINELEIMEYHDQLISMSIFPFLQTSSLSPLGYRFIRTAPLLEKGVKNLDFLICRKTEKATIVIFGEAKSSISNRTKIINEYNERKKVIETHRKYILEQYLGNPTNNVIFEYVLSVFSAEAAKMKESIEQNGGSIILWSADLAFSDLRLEGSRNPQLRHTMSHSDHDLSRSMNKISTSKKTAILFQQSHIVTKLKLIITVKEVANAFNHTKDQRFSLSLLTEYIDKVFFYLDDKTKELEIQNILQKATDMKLITKHEDGGYMISVGPKSIRGQESEFTRRWIQRHVTGKHEDLLSTEINALREQYILKDSVQPRLFD